VESPSFTFLLEIGFFIVVSRDLDSPLLLRERDAVDAWLASNKSFHAMRDHPFHPIPILAGMWGYRPSLHPPLTNHILSKLCNVSLMKRYDRIGDQAFLLNELWDHVKEDMLVHASFHCLRFGPKADPFPTQRPALEGNKHLFVGCVRPCTRADHLLRECPVKCRPEEHKDWLYC
jgi:hypothetical protein